MEQITLEAPDISCDHCIQSIQKAVQALPGARLVSGDPAAKQVIVEYDPAQTPLDKIEAALEEEGYPVQK
ncbi:MAG TPA: heavy-metal-associated domain-containing protein [Dehalococcoidia bacterium]|nr:heavy-metal-associated domain-containing protein [Dehalococcoidia bacterium]